MKIDFLKNMFFQNESENKYSQELRKILKKSKFPVLICSFERPYYLKIMIKQLNKLKIKPIVLDNNSKDIKLVSFLKKNNRKKFYLIRLNQNYGNEIIYKNFIWKYLPNFFAFTDSDILFNKKLDPKFLYKMKKYTEKYKIQKIGFAIDIFDKKNLKKIKCRYAYRSTKGKIKIRYKPLRSAELNHWKKRIALNPDIYGADVDTTFAVYNKKYFEKNRVKALRIASNYTSVHLPWMKYDKIKNKELNLYLKNKNKNIGSTIIKLK
jgi:hypothetical protein